MNFIIRPWNTQREMEIQGDGGEKLKGERKMKDRGGERRGCHSGSVCQYWQRISPLAGDWNNSQLRSNYERCLLLWGNPHFSQHASMPSRWEACIVTCMWIWMYASPIYFLLQYVTTNVPLGNHHDHRRPKAAAVSRPQWVRTGDWMTHLRLRAKKAFPSLSLTLPFFLSLLPPPTPSYLLYTYLHLGVSQVNKGQKPFQRRVLSSETTEVSCIPVSRQ